MWRQPISVEFRNKTWMSERNRAETLDFPTSYAIGVCLHRHGPRRPKLDPPVLAATADLWVVRFHGHSEKWTSKDIHERFGYLYGEAELAEWAPTLRGLADDAAQTHVPVQQLLLQLCAHQRGPANSHAEQRQRSPSAETISTDCRLAISGIACWSAHGARGFRGEEDVAG
jgi:uncharacterized protein YecE (DUF72 family)